MSRIDITDLLDQPQMNVDQDGYAMPVSDVLTASSSAGLGPVDVAVVTEYWNEEVDGTLLPFVGQTYTGSAVGVAVGLADGFPDPLLSGVPMVTDEFTQVFLGTVKGDFVGIGDDMFEDVREILVQGVKNGESIEQIAAKMLYVTEFSKTRATEIARTVTHAAAESGSIAQLRFVGYTSDDAKKKWVTSHDARVRPSHILADRQTVALDAAFSVGGATLDFPGDPSGPSSEIRQCRCTMFFEIDDAPKLRCGSALVAALPTASATGTYCVTPTPSPASIVAPDVKVIITQAWPKVTPAYGGAAIHKAILLVRAKLTQMGHNDQALDDWTILSVIDEAKPSKSAFTFTSKYHAYAQSDAGKKLGIPPPSTAVTHAVVPSAPPQPKTPALPPVAPKPDPSDIVFTGQVLGSHGAQVWRNPVTGERWLFKPQQKFMTDLDVGIAKIQSKAGETRPGIYSIEIGGQKGSIQYMFESDEAWPHGTFDPLKLTPEEILVLQQGQIFDWMISNFDTHSGQWIRLTSGRLFGTDKGQAFKFFGKDKLDWDFVPVYPLGQDKLTYSAMWQAYVQGKDIDLLDPTTGELAAYIQRLMSIPDDEYRALLMPYAAWREKMGIGTAKKFLDDAVARKNNLATDFAEFWARAQAARAKTAPKPKPVVPGVQPPTSGKMFATSAEPDIPPVTAVHLDGPKKWDLMEMFIAADYGTKVTPAWGGAKIWKLVKELKVATKEPSNGFPPMTEMQILEVLDDVGGFKGKPKSYVSVVSSWLDSPAGKKVVPVKPIEFKMKASPLAAGTKPVISVTTKPSHISGKNVGDETYENEILLTKGPPPGSIIAYAEMKPGTSLFPVRVVVNPNGAKVLEYRDSSGMWKTDLQWDVDSMGLPSIGIQGWKAADGSVFPTTAPVSKIPGKMPGDTVSSADIEASRLLWSSGEEIAKGPLDSAGGFPTLVSDGHGGVELWYQVGGGGAKWAVKKYPSTKPLPKTIYATKQWKLSGSAITPSVPSPKTKPSVVPSKNAGDVVTQQDIASYSASDIMQLAYSYDAGTGLEYRIVMQFGTLKMEARTPGTTVWSHIVTDVDEPFNFKMYFESKTWYAADKNGGMPDVVKALVPNAAKTPPAMKTPSLIAFKDVGDDVTPAQIDNTVAAPGSVIAEGIQPTTKLKYRVIIDEDGNPRVQLKTGSKWIDTGTPLKDYGTQIEWKAAASMLPKSQIPKSLVPSKKALTGTQTHIPGKTTNDVVSSGEIWDAHQLYVEGQIIATRSHWSGEYRVFVADGKLIQQKQTKAGAWGGTKILPTKWSFTITGGWKPSTDMISPQHLKNAKKFVQKKTTIVTPPSSPKPATTYSPQAPAQPFTPQPIDLSSWSAADQQAVYQALRAKSVSTHSSASDVWDFLAVIKADLVKKDSKFSALDEITILRIYDTERAKHFGVVNTHVLEAKVVTWLQTPAGKIHVGKKMSAPVLARDVPKAMSALDDPSNPHPDQQKYVKLSNPELIKARQDDHTRYGGWRGGERAALREYTGGVYSSWNAAIRLGDLKGYRAKIIAAQQGMRPSTRPMLLIRKASYSEFNDPSIKTADDLRARIGQRFVTRGFSSTSNTGTWSGTVHFEIECPIGTPMARVQDFSHYPSENETMLAAHLIYEIRDVKLVGGHTVVRVRVVGAYDPADDTWS